ncbi:MULTISPECIES: transcriptional regulator [Amycolatopsis]|uniref:Transcriptional regulator n=2 Tax=Amycolatopsis TaxID=1813 RepID=A0ABW5ICR3_9PSEU
MNEPNAPFREAEYDRLLNRLRERLAELVQDALAREFSAKQFAETAESDLERISGEVEHRMAGNADETLGATNPQIEELWAAEKTLAAHDNPANRPAGARAAHAMFGLALWFGIGYPLLWWQLQQAFSGLAWFFTVVVLLVAGPVGVWAADRLTARSGKKLIGRTVVNAEIWPFVSFFPTVYLLLLWRLLSSSREAMGGFWSGALWIAAGVVAVGAFLVALSVATVVLETEEPGQRLPAAVVVRGLMAVVLALAAAYFVLVAAVGWPPFAKYVVADAVTLLVMIGFAPLTLSSWLIPPLLSRDERRKNSPSWKQVQAKLRNEVTVAEERWGDAARTEVEQRVKTHLTNVLNPDFTTTLPAYDRHALGQMRAGDRVRTSVAAADRLRELLAGIEGGVIGMAGSRGAGKSTLLEAYRAGKFLEGGYRHIAVMESVPVRYEAREFMLHLYSQTCAEVIKFCRQRGPDEDVASPRRRGWDRRSWPVLAAVLAWLLVGAVGTIVSAAFQADLRAQPTTLWWPLACLFGAAATLSLAARRRPAARLRESSPPPVAKGDLVALRKRAEWARDGIRFQQKHTSGWSGKTGVPMVEAGISGAQEATRNPLTYPEVVHEFLRFVEATIECLSALPKIAPAPVVIIIDELDKIADPDLAHEFINEMKALTAVDVSGLLCLISVSEDALAAFELRGLSVRDAFDSAFDTIVRLEYLALTDAREVLSSRVVGLPDPFISLCHCLAGGLPRELIRVARRMFAGGAELAAIARRLVAEDLAAKRFALLTVVGKAEYDEVLASALVRHLDARTAAEPGALIAAVAAPPVSAGVDVAPALLRLQTETLGYLYYLGTVLEVFGPAFAPGDLERGRAAGDGSFDTLASARQLFPVNARLAWLTISAFRRAWALRVVEPPSA